MFSLKPINFRKTVPGFIPRGDSLNCDPTFELEERIVNSSTIYNTGKKTVKNEESLQKSIDQFSAAFYCYNRKFANSTNEKLFVDRGTQELFAQDYPIDEDTNSPSVV